MKKIYILTILFSSLAFSGFSQFEVKAFIGINGATYKGLAEGLSQSSNLGYQGGAAILFGTTWYFEPGVVWYGTSTSLSVDSIGSGQNIKNNITGLKVPLMVGYRFFGRTENLLNLRLFVGASADFISKIKFDEVEWDKDLYNDVNWNANFGFGLDIWFLYLELGYELGLSEIYNSNSFGNLLKQNDLYVNLGFRIKFGNKSRGRSKKK
jgi:hypothetical protein